ncbi:MAG: hypothetical protein R2711_08360 [Acidimicrobiales bacterium]
MEQRRAQLRSRVAIAWDSAGWLTGMEAAAAVKVPWSTTATT